MKKKIGDKQYEIVKASVVKPSGAITMSDGGKGSCFVGLEGPAYKPGDEFAVVDGKYVSVAVLEELEHHKAAKSIDELAGRVQQKTNKEPKIKAPKLPKLGRKTKPKA